MVVQIPELGPLADVGEVVKALAVLGIVDRVPDEAELAAAARRDGSGGRELLLVEMLEGLSGGVEMQLMLATTRAGDAGADGALVNQASLEWFTGAGCRDTGTRIALLRASAMHLSNLLLVLVAEGRRGNAEVPLVAMHALTVVAALKDMLEATDQDADYKALMSGAAEALRSAAELLDQAPAMASLTIPADERIRGRGD